MSRTYATNLFEEAPRASGRVVVGVLVAHGLLLFVASHEGLLHLAAFRSWYEATAPGRVLTPDLLEAWAGLVLEVGLILVAVGGLRPRELGLRLGAMPAGLAATAVVWLGAQVPLLALRVAQLRGLLPETGADAPPSDIPPLGPLRWALGWGLLNGVVFQVFLLTQFAVRLGDRLAGRPAWRWAMALVASQLAFVLLLDAARWDVLAAELRASPLQALQHNAWPWLSGLCLAWMYLRSGNLFYTVGVGTLLRFSEQLLLSVRGPIAGEVAAAMVVGAGLLVAEGLHRRLLRQPYVDYAQLDGRPLPRRLSDPLLTFRRTLGWWLVAAPIVVVLSLGMPELAPQAITLTLLLPLFVFLWLALPGRRTNAFYLRAFRTDAHTADIRKALQAALGRRYRLSGIRAPARRWPQWLRSLVRVAFCLRYSSVRYMNLEARQDWLARLWRSMAEARCAFVDLIDLTTYVDLEIALACRALGPDRVLFLGDASRDVAAWQALVCERLGPSGTRPEDIHVALWAGTAPRELRPFMASVQAFARGLPPGEAGLNWSAFPLVRSAALTSGQRWREAAYEAATLLLSLVPALGLELAVRALGAFPSRAAAVAGWGMAAAMFAFLVASVVQFVRQCPTRRQAVGFSLGFVGVLAAYASMAVALLAGAYPHAWSELVRSAQPAGPVVRVEATYPGAGSLVVASTVAPPIEQQVSGLEQLEQIRSWSLADGSYVLDLAFAPGANPDLARQQVRDRIEQARPALPEAVNRAGLTVRARPRGPLALVTVSAPDGRYDALYLSAFARAELVRALKRAPGVQDVSLLGGLEPSWRVYLDHDRLERFGVRASEVSKAVEEAVRAPADAGGPFQPGRLGELEITSTSGQAIPLGALAQVAQVVERPGFASLDQKPVVVLAVSATPAARAHEVIGALRAALERPGGRTPEGLRVEIRFDFTPNLEAPDAPTTPAYLLVDLALPDAASIDHVTRALARCEVLLKQDRGVREVLSLTENPFDLPRNRPCLLARLDPSGPEHEPDGRALLMKRLHEQIAAQVPGVQAQIRDLSGLGPFPTVEFPLDVAVVDTGDIGLRGLLDAAGTLAADLRACPALLDPAARRPRVPLDEAYVAVNDAAAKARGVPRDEVVAALGRLVHEPAIGSLRLTGGGGPQAEARFQVSRDDGPWRLSGEAARSAATGRLDEDLKNTRVPSAGGATVPLAELVTVERVSEPDVVQRLNMSPMIEVTASLEPGASLDEARACVRRHVQDSLPAALQAIWLSGPGRGRGRNLSRER